MFSNQDIFTQKTNLCKTGLLNLIKLVIKNVYTKKYYFTSI